MVDVRKADGLIIGPAKRISVLIAIILGEALKVRATRERCIMFVLLRSFLEELYASPMKKQNFLGGK